MKFRYREMVCRPDFYEFDNADCMEWFRVGIYSYNISRIISDISEYVRTSDNPYLLPYGICRQRVSVSEVIGQMCCCGEGELRDEHVEAADLSRPILLVEISPDMYNLADGHHRLEKARRLGIAALDAYIIPALAAVRYLGSEKEYRDYVRYWNSKVEDRQDDSSFQGNWPLASSAFRDRDLNPDYIWYQIVICLKECRRVEIYKGEGEWFTLFRLNGRYYCGEAEAQTSVRCAAPFAVTDDRIRQAVEYVVDWYNTEMDSAAVRERRKEIRRLVRHADILMACIRVFSE